MKSASTPDLVAPYPIQGCLRIPKHFVDRAKQSNATNDPNDLAGQAINYELGQAIHIETERLAAERGYRRGKLSRTNVGRIIPGLPEAAIYEIGVNPRWPSLRCPNTRRGRLIGAKKLKSTLTREICALARSWRHARLFIDERGRPATIVSFLETKASDKYVDDYLDRVWLETSWGLEQHYDSRFWYVYMFASALEICKPGCSILAATAEGRRLGDSVILGLSD